MNAKLRKCAIDMMTKSAWNVPVILPPTYITDPDLAEMFFKNLSNMAGTGTAHLADATLALPSTTAKFMSYAPYGISHTLYNYFSTPMSLSDSFLDSMDDIDTMGEKIDRAIGVAGPRQSLQDYLEWADQNYYDTTGIDPENPDNIFDYLALKTRNGTKAVFRAIPDAVACSATAGVGSGACKGVTTAATTQGNIGTKVMEGVSTGVSKGLDAAKASMNSKITGVMAGMNGMRDQSKITDKVTEGIKVKEVAEKANNQPSTGETSRFQGY